MCKRPLQDSGASVKKRHRTSSRTVTDDDSEIIESEESEALPETFGGETKESDSDRRGRQKKERKRQRAEEAAERQRQRDAKGAASKLKECIANIGGIRVEKNGIIEFEGGKTFEKWTKQEAEDNTGISLSAINNNINKKRQSRGKKGMFKDQQVMFINAPVADRVPCEHCDSHYSSRRNMLRHVREKHPGILPPAAQETTIKPETFTFMTQKKYAFLVRRVKDNIKADLKKSEMKKLMALVEGYDEPWGSVNLAISAKKFHLSEQQILDSIANNEELTIGGGLHRLGTTDIKLAGLKVTFSWKYKVTEEDKIKLTEMNNNETRHMIARQICEHMNKEGMFADENVTDDNGGLIKNGFEFENHGGLFNLSFDRIEDEYTVNGQTFRKMHFTNLENALENIHVVAHMANVQCKASTKMIQDRYDIYKNKSEDQREKEFKKVLEISKISTHNGKNTTLYQHAKNTLKKDEQCKGAFDTYQAYWRHLLVLLEKQEGLCKVAKIPMSLESGPWLMSCDAIVPKKGHVPGNLRLVCFYNNPPDFSKLNKDLTDTTPTSLNTVLHDEYWRIVR